MILFHFLDYGAPLFHPLQMTRSCVNEYAIEISYSVFSFTLLPSHFKCEYPKQYAVRPIIIISFRFYSMFSVFHLTSFSLNARKIWVFSSFSLGEWWGKAKERLLGKNERHLLSIDMSYSVLRWREKERERGELRKERLRDKCNRIVK